jgi:histone acetyltransferase
MDLVGETGKGYLERDKGVKKEQDDGIIEFKCIKNDKSETNIKYLIDLKWIIAKQLPRMPKPYIVRLIMDRIHESIIILKKVGDDKPKELIGGVVYRPFYEQKFFEIAFLTIVTTEQYKGYGTRIMNVLKDYAQSKNIDYFVTYADNHAIEYFKKQGFSTKLRIPEEKYKGYIKHYDGGTIMDCYINKKIDFQNISNIMKKQKELIMTIIANIAHRKIYKGLDFSKKQTYDFKDIPGLAEAGWTEEDYKNSVEDDKTFEEHWEFIVKKLQTHKSSWPFLKPVNKEDVSDYYEVIKEPIDLQTISFRIKEKCYKDVEMFENDVIRMFTNCKQYNDNDTIYWLLASSLQEYILPYLKKMKDKYSTA